MVEEVAEEVWKLLLTHCPCLRPGGGAASEAWTCLDLPSSWKQRFRPSLLNCQLEACHGTSLAFLANIGTDKVVSMYKQETMVEISVIIFGVLTKYILSSYLNDSKKAFFLY